MHDALRQVLSAAAALRKDHITYQVERRVGLMIMPVVVVEAPIVHCSLNPSGDVDLKEVDFVHVWARGGGEAPQRVCVLRESRLPAFAEALSDLAQVAASTASGT